MNTTIDWRSRLARIARRAAAASTAVLAGLLVFLSVSHFGTLRCRWREPSTASQTDIRASAMTPRVFAPAIKLAAYRICA
jgi:hypothetical protein